MKSIGVRLAVWYVLASTVTFASLFLVGRYFTERHAIRALDLLNESEYEQIKIRFGPAGEPLGQPAIQQRMRETMADDLNLFYIEIHQADGQVLFTSHNLHGRTIFTKSGRKAFNANVSGLGELRAGAFTLGPLNMVIATSKRHVRDVMVGYEQTFYGLLAVMIVVSSVIGYGLSRMALRPVRLIEETANRISSDNLSERIPVSAAQDEISDLARLLNQMFDRLESSFDQIRRFTAEASHELKTPLTLIRLQAEKLLVEGNLAPSQEQAVQVQVKELEQLNRIIEELLFLSRAEARAITLDLKVQSPEGFLHSFVQDARVLAEFQGRRIFYTHHGEGCVAFEQKWLRQVLLNVLTNALAASPLDGRITLRSVLVNGLWQVSVEDEGPGVPAEQRERIFERFVRLKRSDAEDKGSGLGLAICRSIVELHGGRISAEAGAGDRGLRVVIELPIAESVANAN
ncbi:MAG TPA: ATP-binding protein [Paraburkholderia sp.]|uniref:HAMP domain-containing sensor histidine kinase n=1 Tax=Paraburkholderia sp. TaxID=1926495 RepID=UPI002ED616BD